MADCAFDHAEASHAPAAPPFRLRASQYIAGGTLDERREAARYFAAAMFPDDRGEDCSYFVVRPGQGLGGYAGQPVLLWEGFTPASLVHEYGARGVVDLFSASPPHGEGRFEMDHDINVIVANEGETYASFMEGLGREIGEGRHFPPIFCTHAESLLYSREIERRMGFDV